MKTRRIFQTLALAVAVLSVLMTLTPKSGLLPDDAKLIERIVKESR
ncbi:MAG TPA: hypothetical protein VEV81_01195 [Pyrinomonadaceae bacterium]|nr:hypothetical protein [Pyrinomonadaceae bacterium]